MFKEIAIALIALVLGVSATQGQQSIERIGDWWKLSAADPVFGGSSVDARTAGRSGWIDGFEVGCGTSYFSIRIYLPGARKLEGYSSKESVVSLGVAAQDVIIEFPVSHIVNSELDRLTLVSRPNSETKVIQLLERMQHSTIDLEIDLQSGLWPGTVPLNSAGSKKVAEDVLAHCKAKFGKPYTMIGANVRPTNGGLEVGVVYPRAGAARAGLRVGDVITALDQQPTTDVSGFSKVIRSHLPGAKISLSVVRKEGDQLATLNIEVELSTSDVE